MTKRVTTVQFDERTAENIDKLREVYGATSTAAVIRRALALASLVAREATPDRTVTITGKGLETAAERVVTAQVLMALLGATTVQLGSMAVIMAKYLFPGPIDKAVHVDVARIHRPGGIFSSCSYFVHALACLGE